jgi:hypothetical protein
MPQLGVAIFGVVVLNGVFAFAQEERAEQAAERLRDLLRRVTVVWDDAAEQIPAAGMVTGDTVLLAEATASPPTCGSTWCTRCRSTPRPSRARACPTIQAPPSQPTPAPS